MRFKPFFETEDMLRSFAQDHEMGIMPLIDYLEERGVPAQYINNIMTTYEKTIQEEIPVSQLRKTFRDLDAAMKSSRQLDITQMNIVDHMLSGIIKRKLAEIVKRTRDSLAKSYPETGQPGVMNSYPQYVKDLDKLAQVLNDNLPAYLILPVTERFSEDNDYLHIVILVKRIVGAIG